MDISIIESIKGNLVVRYKDTGKELFEAKRIIPHCDDVISKIKIEIKRLNDTIHNYEEIKDKANRFQKLCDGRYKNNKTIEKIKEELKNQSINIDNFVMPKDDCIKRTANQIIIDYQKKQHHINPVHYKDNNGERYCKEHRPKTHKDESITSNIEGVTCPDCIKLMKFWKVIN